MKKIILLFIMLILLPLFIMTSCASTYTGRLLKYGGNPYENFSKFPNHVIQKSNDPFFFSKDNNQSDLFLSRIESITWRTSQGLKTSSLEDMLEQTESLAFLVIKDDIILYEKYFDGCTRETIFPAFSVSKSITSTLIGIAVDEGNLPGIDVPVKDFLHQFYGKGYDKITIRNLLEMNAGFEHLYGLSPKDDLVISSFHPEVEDLAFQQTLIRNPGEIFEYNNYNTILLGLILQNVTGMSPSEYLEKKVWQPMGMEFDGSWNMSKEEGFEYMGSGINAAVMDYAKFGRLYLNRGNWNGRQIVSPNWIIDSTTTDPSINGADDYYDTQISEEVNKFFENEGYYSMHWWGVKNVNSTYEFYAVGMYGQYIYICPEKNMILVRMGRSFGDVSWWPDIFRDIAYRF